MESNRKWRHRSMASTACFLSLILTWRTKIFGSDWSILTSDRSPETFETRIGSWVRWQWCQRPSTRRGKGRRRCGNLNEDSICKRNKKVSIIINDSKNLPYFPYNQCNMMKNNYNEFIIFKMRMNIGDLKSVDHFSTDSVLKQYLFCLFYLLWIIP